MVPECRREWTPASRKQIFHEKPELEWSLSQIALADILPQETK